MNTEMYLPLTPLTRTFVLMTLLFATTAGSAQPLTERLGGITTAFTITSSDIVLNDTEQILIRRARGYHGTRTVYEGGAGYGYGFNSMHLEFHSVYSIRTQVRKEDGRRKFYEATFLDSDNEVLAKIAMSPDAVRRFSSKQVPPLFTYSIDLEGVPLILLDRVATIHIDRVEIR